MASDSAAVPWSSELRAKVEAATRQAQGLMELTPLPELVSGQGGHDEWPIVGRALVARARGSLESIMALVPVRRETDAASLLRDLFEHITTFAWLAGDPAARMPLWVKNDRIQRRRVDNDFREIGPPFVDSDTRHGWEQLIATTPGEMPPMPQRAEAVDRDWGPRPAALQADSTELRSFRGLYRAIWREGTFYSHPTALGLEPLVAKVGEAERVILADEIAPSLFNAFTIAPAVYALALFVAGEAFSEWPTEQAVDDVFVRFPFPSWSEGRV